MVSIIFKEFFTGSNSYIKTWNLLFRFYAEVFTVIMFLSTECFLCWLFTFFFIFFIIFPRMTTKLIQLVNDKKKSEQVGGGPKWLGQAWSWKKGLCIDKKKFMSLRNKMRVSPFSWPAAPDSRPQTHVHTAVFNLLLAVVSEKWARLLVCQSTQGKV